MFRCPPNRGKSTGEPGPGARALDDAHAAALALNVLGNVAFHQGEYAAARQLHQESLTLRRTLDDRRGIAVSLNNLANATWELGDHREAARLYEASLAMHREVGDRYGMASTGVNLADAARIMGDYTEAGRRLRESLAMFREMGERHGIAYALSMLASVTMTLGEPAEAQPLLEECLILFREIGNHEGIALTLTQLGRVATARGDACAAREHLREALATALAIRALPIALTAVVELAVLLAREGPPEATERAVEYLALVLAHPASEQEARDRAARLLTDLEAALAPQRVAAARERGQAGTVEAVMEQILDVEHERTRE